MRKTRLTPELRHSAYLAFQNIRQRCTNRNNKDFLDYGGRGIECALSQEEFAAIYYRTDSCVICRSCGRRNGKIPVRRTATGKRKINGNGSSCLPTPFQKNDGKWYVGS